MFSLGHIQSVFYNYLVVVVRQEHEVCDKDTVEERILQLQEKKQLVFEG